MTPRHLDETSKHAFVDYYSCPACRHIWTIDKRDPARVTHVTPLPKKRPPTSGAA
jgi:hypothetical protein